MPTLSWWVAFGMGYGACLVIDFLGRVLKDADAWRSYQRKLKGLD